MVKSPLSRELRICSRRWLLTCPRPHFLSRQGGDQRWPLVAALFARRLRTPVGVGAERVPSVAGRRAGPLSRDGPRQRVAMGTAAAGAGAPLRFPLVDGIVSRR